MSTIARCCLWVGTLILATFLTSIHAADKNSKAIQDQERTMAVLKNGEIATSANGFFMKAKIDGKDWAATKMMPPEATGRILGAINDNESISLPFSRSSLGVGKTRKFSENNAVDLFTDDDIGIWAGYSGEMTYTKVDDQSAEGTFHFTATSRNSSKKIEVTNGTFRILFREKKS